ncbi:hypothetical protein GGD50_002294 [Rhizobium paranaense]|uniref:Uncharacterized protein n=1 Tax=Rhizobium paranaense TaxID=1650438 RepID=A0A7W9D1B6_9HYPH|nr:hypothetical protein [Rhizobium paranaense]
MRRSHSYGYATGNGLPITTQTKKNARKLVPGVLNAYSRSADLAQRLMSASRA